MSYESSDYRPVSELDFFRDNFFLEDGEEALVGPKDLLKAIRDHPQQLNPATMEPVDHYWLHEHYSYAVIVYSHTESEYWYWCIEPNLSPAERKQLSYLEEKIRIVAEDKRILEADNDELADIIQSILFDLVKRYDLADPEVLDQTSDVAAFQPHKTVTEDGEDPNGWKDKAMTAVSRWLERLSTDRQVDEGEPGEIEGSFTQTLSPKQVDKITYYLIRDIVGQNKINPLSHDFHIEDISCDGYDEPVFVHHTEYEEMWSNIHFHEEELDNFIKHLAQSSGKGISKRDPVVDVELDDGSRANLTLGTEVTTKGSNFTIRQFKDVPFTPVDLINWETYSLEQMTYLWHAIEFGKNAIFAGGTASGKTTTLNAVSLFIPSKTKIVSIEDTPELELPHKNWVSSVTRSGGRSDNRDEFAEFDLLKNSFRQRPTYIVLGEVRGEEGRTLFQAMSSGHTSYTTFHADNANELVQRFTGDHIGVDPTAIGRLDLICNQQQVQVDGSKVRRSTEIKEVMEHDEEHDEVRFRSMYEWVPRDDAFEAADESKVLQDIRYRNGWSDGQFAREFQMRQVVLAYLVREGYSEYAQVAGTLQAFMNDPETIMHYIATDQLGEYLQQLRNMKNIEIQVDPEVEEQVNRPKPSGEVLDEANQILDGASDLLQEFRNLDVGQAFKDADNPFEDDSSILDQAAEAGHETAQAAMANGEPASEPLGHAPTPADRSATADEDAGEDTDDDQDLFDEYVEANLDVSDATDGAETEASAESTEAASTEPMVDQPESMATDSLEEADAAEANATEGPDERDATEPSEEGGESGGIISRVLGGGSKSQSEEEDPDTADDGADSENADDPQEAEGLESPPLPDEHSSSEDPSESATESPSGDDNPTHEAGAPAEPPLPDEPAGGENGDSSVADQSEASETTMFELYLDAEDISPDEIPFDFDPDGCHFIIQDDEDGYRQCETPVGDKKKCHFHQGKEPDISVLEGAFQEAVADGVSE